MKTTIFLISFCITMCIVILNLFSFPYEEWPAKMVSDPNYLFKWEIEKFYKEQTLRRIAYFGSTSLYKHGLTYDFRVFLQLPETKITSTNQAEKNFSELFIEHQKLLNSIPHIRPFLAEFPIPAHRLVFSVTFHDNKDNYLPPPNINSVRSSFNGQLKFSMHNLIRNQKPIPLIKKTLTHSPYLKTYVNPSVKRTYPKHQIIIPLYKSDPCDPPHWKAVASFMSRMAARRNLFLLRLLPVGEKERDTTPFGFALWGKDKLTFEESRILGISYAWNFLCFIRKDKDCLKFMKNRKQKAKNISLQTEPEPRHFSFRISLWDEGINRQPSPFIAEIRYDKGFFRYFTSDEGQRLVLVHEESFEDALLFLYKKLFPQEEGTQKNI